MPRPINVFVSYSRKQEDWVALFVEQWRELGVEVFIDRNIRSHQLFAEEISKALGKCRKLVLMLTREALNSDWVKGELSAVAGRILTRDLKLFTVMLERVNPDEAPEYVKTAQWVDLTNTETEREEYHRFLRELGVKSPTLPGPPPKPLSKILRLNRGSRVLAIGSHWDDILLGCFGTLLKLHLLYDYQVTLAVLCTNYHGQYYGVTQPDLEKRAANIYRAIKQRHPGFTDIFTPEKRVVIEDRRFRDKSKELRDTMEMLATSSADSSLILSPPADDHHEDHSLTGQLAFSYFREPYQTILEYQIKTYTDRWFVPNVFVSLDEKAPANRSKRCVADLKVELLSELIVEREETRVEGSDFLFGLEPLRARLMVNALDHGGNKLIKYGEVFRGRITI